MRRDYDVVFDPVTGKPRNTLAKGTIEFTSEEASYTLSQLEEEQNKRRDPTALVPANGQLKIGNDASLQVYSVDGNLMSVGKTEFFNTLRAKNQQASHPLMRLMREKVERFDELSPEEKLKAIKDVIGDATDTCDNFEHVSDAFMKKVGGEDLNKKQRTLRGNNTFRILYEAFRAGRNMIQLLNVFELGVATN